MDAVIELLLKHWHVAAPLILLCASFAMWFLAPAATLDRTFKAMSAALAALRGATSTDPDDVKVADPQLARLWSQYCETLQVEAPPDWKALLGAGETRSATVAADSIFSESAVIDERLHTEFFKHLPGLLTGLGIIGTFGGLIRGLGAATASGTLQTEPLIDAVRDAFSVSAAAIAAAMLATFLEKFLYARLQRKLAGLCRQIDGLYDASHGEHYMPRLVRASEQAATNTGQLNENLVGELRDFLLRLVERQKELGERQDARLQQLVTMMQRPADLGRRVERPGRGGSGTGAETAREPVAEVAEAFAKALADQEAQTRGLHERMIKSLDANSEQMKQTLTDMARRHEEVTEALRELIGALRPNAGAKPKPETPHKTLPETPPESRRLTSGTVLDLAEMLAQMQARAAE